MERGIKQMKGKGMSWSKADILKLLNDWGPMGKAKIKSGIQRTRLTTNRLMDELIEEGKIKRYWSNKYHQTMYKLSKVKK
jgi:predicted transcriptional regulator